MGKLLSFPFMFTVQHTGDLTGLAYSEFDASKLGLVFLLHFLLVTFFDEIPFLLCFIWRAVFCDKALFGIFIFAIETFFHIRIAKIHTVCASTKSNYKFWVSVHTFCGIPIGVPRSD